MQLSRINQFLSNLDNLERAKELSLISNDQSDDFYEEKNQGGEGKRVKIYAIQGETELFLKVVELSDSYGSNVRVGGIQFVSAQEKVVTIFEPIK